VQVPRSSPRLPVAKITGQGLTSIAIVVALLWTCVIGERLIRGSAAAEAAQVMRDMRQLRLKNRQLPAAAPARPRPVRPQTAIG